MDTPFLLFDNGDVSLFTSLDALGGYVESPDVAGYLATDRNGRILRLTCSSPTSAASGTRLVVPVTKVNASLTDEFLDSADFRDRLLQFLRQMSVEPDESVSSADLVESIVRSIGYTA
jgi:hypothetical protein